MPLDEASTAIVARIDETMARIGTEITDPAEARLLTATPPEALANPTPVGSVEDRTIPGLHGYEVPVRVYRPLDESADPPPVMLFCHGGGWVLGDLDGHDGICRQLSNRVGCVVLSVGYRLAPEHGFPAPLEDMYAALVWTAAHSDDLRVDRTRLIVAGDSSGGNLAAAAALLARDRNGPPIAFQLLVYPVVDHDFGRDSYVENGSGYPLSAGLMRWFWDHYADESVRLNPYATPMRAPDLANLPPAHIVSAQYDVLRDEDEAYARRLRDAGVAVSLRCYPGAFHGFFGFGARLPVARKAFDDAVRQVRAALGTRMTSART
ncbi:alpha/beta hydrolase [Streptomyces malaysiensis]|uniref:Alpha/beta hydrolase fold-3 domain-containing protein n=1 Tax=Streptomyces malaysiensis TaxID=92644 RepID=A0A7X5X079_STRMQ|nr:alpha/beta hydrolase [Streptomyces malaysiensis]NIY64202.1 hypothetical protein [Streptomyces malaysiensis]